MLQQILRDLYVDPEILAELDEQQKQTLFCKMREEQVRRWKVWDQQQENNDTNNKLYSTHNRHKPKKTVSFMKGADGEPWVWVMGEHPDDKSIEDILKEEAIEKARKLAEQEAEELRKQVEATLSEYLTPTIEDLNQPAMKIEDDTDIYCSVDELREKINNKPKNIDYSLNHYQNKNKYNLMDSRDVLQEISINTQKVAQKVALWEKRLTEERASEIYKKIQRKHMEVAREAEEAEQKQEQLWKEQERKAKQAEQQIREIARRAREEHRLTSGLEIQAPITTVNAGVPPGKQAVLEWYRNKERPRNAAIDAFNNIEPWFHGLITRLAAETLLQDQPDGSFLVRLSERIWGYAISYRAKDKCKHYLVNAGQKYSFLGNNQLEHKALGDLIEHHRVYALSGGEKLVHACPRDGDAAIKELLGDTVQ